MISGKCKYIKEYIVFIYINKDCCSVFLGSCCRVQSQWWKNAIRLISASVHSVRLKRWREKSWVANIELRWNICVTLCHQSCSHWRHDNNAADFLTFINNSGGVGDNHWWRLFAVRQNIYRTETGEVGSCHGGKWVRKSGYLVSHWNMSQRSTAQTNPSSIQGTRGCFLVVRPTDLMEDEAWSVYYSRITERSLGVGFILMWFAFGLNTACNQVFNQHHIRAVAVHNATAAVLALREDSP